MTRQTYSLDELKHMALAQIDALVDRYAPVAHGSCRRERDCFCRLNPGRADDTRPGSFVVHFSGPRAGTFHDFASNDRGDLIDLIALATGSSITDAIRELRAHLGLEAESPEMRRRLEQRAAAAREKRRQAARDERAKRERRRKRAHAIWLAGSTDLGDSPVGAYLRDARGIDLRAFAHVPGALRYVSTCRYYHEDEETGEVIEGQWPAMVALVMDPRGQVAGCHRTYLAPRHGGGWGKAPVAKAKLTLGPVQGGAIHLSRGDQAGPRGGKPPSLFKAPAGTHVAITEGIENALSAMILAPEWRVLSAWSLSNLGDIVLPDTVTAVTLIADHDTSAAAQAGLERAIGLHRRAGRAVRVWQAPQAGRDLNDALREALAERQGAA